MPPFLKLFLRNIEPKVRLNINGFVTPLRHCKDLLECQLNPVNAKPRGQKAINSNRNYFRQAMFIGEVKTELKHPFSRYPYSSPLTVMQ